MCRRRFAARARSCVLVIYSVPTRASLSLSHNSEMDELDAIPSISSGAVGSRFVTQSEVDTAKARREEQWKAAYARYSSLRLDSQSCAAHVSCRLGQEPPPPPAEDAFDGRSLAEVSPQF